MALADSLQKVANKAIGKFGGNVTIQSITLSDYNTETGSAIESIQTQDVKGVLENVNASEVNDLVRSDDKKLTIATASLNYELQLSDKILITGVTYQIVNIKTIEQGSKAIVYQVFLRA